MGGRGSESRINGRIAEEIVARYMNEPIGDSGQPWEGDNIDARYLNLSDEVKSTNSPIINITTIQNKVDRWLDQDTFKLSTIKEINQTKKQLEQIPMQDRNRQIILLLQDINDLLREIR